MSTSNSDLGLKLTKDLSSFFVSSKIFKAAYSLDLLTLNSDFGLN